MRGAWWWIDSWRGSPAFTDMNAEEQGLFRNLCDELWIRPGNVIPEDALPRASGDPIAWARSGQKVLRHMSRVEGGWTNEKALEVIEESRRRADKQQAFRERRRGNDTGNEAGNGAGNDGGNKRGSPSPSPSIRISTEQPIAPAGDGGQKRNPLCDRSKHEPEFLRLCRAIGALTGEDGDQVASRQKRFGDSRKLNPASMSDDRLLNALADLRLEYARLERDRQETQAVAEVEQEPAAIDAWDRIDVKLRATVEQNLHATWFRGVRPVTLRGRKLAMELPSEAHRNQMRGPFRERVLKAIADAGLDLEPLWVVRVQRDHTHRGSL